MKKKKKLKINHGQEGKKQNREKERGRIKEREWDKD